jgi:hypothetical protein
MTSGHPLAPITRIGCNTPRLYSTVMVPRRARARPNALLSAESRNPDERRIKPWERSSQINTRRIMAQGLAPRWRVDSSRPQAKEAGGPLRARRAASRVIAA